MKKYYGFRAEQPLFFNGIKELILTKCHGTLRPPSPRFRIRLSVT